MLTLDERFAIHRYLPKCVMCKAPTPDEFVDPYLAEAGERMCDDCGRAARHGERLTNRRRESRRRRG